jgi:hypothetical protein
VTPVPEALDELIRRSHKRRNYLVLTFFRENMDVLYSVDFDEIVSGLNEHISLFQDTDSELTAILEPLWLKFGWTVEGIEAEAMRYKVELNTKRANE